MPTSILLDLVKAGMTDKILSVKLALQGASKGDLEEKYCNYILNRIEKLDGLPWVAVGGLDRNGEYVQEIAQA